MSSCPTHKIDSAEAAVADLTEVGKQLLRIIFAEELRHIRVLQIARPCTRGHGQRLEHNGHTGQRKWGKNSE